MFVHLQDGVCCPVKYRCDKNFMLPGPGFEEGEGDGIYDDDADGDADESEEDDETDDDDTTSVSPTTSPTTSSSTSPAAAPEEEESADCLQNGRYIPDGETMDSEDGDPCNHCYCMKGKKMCAISKCIPRIKGEADDCRPNEPPPGECCPTSYTCSEFRIKNIPLFSG